MYGSKICQFQALFVNFFAFAILTNCRFVMMIIIMAFKKELPMFVYSYI